MNYRERLSPWCIILLLPQMQRSVVGRFRKRNDAEAHLQALKRLNPTLQYEIIFDPIDPPNEEVDPFGDSAFEERAIMQPETNLHPGYFLE
jgi:hypothetical protein